MHIISLWIVHTRPMSKEKQKQKENKTNKQTSKQIEQTNLNLHIFGRTKTKRFLLELLTYP